MLKYVRFISFVSISLLSFVAQAKVTSFDEIEGRLPALENLRMESNGSYVFLFLHPAGNVFDYREPERTRQSLHPSLSTLHKVPGGIGHAQIAWRCSGSRGVVEGATAQSGEGGDQTRKMIFSGWGLSGAFSTYTDGVMQSNKAIEAALEKGKLGRFTWIGFRVSNENCLHAAAFVREYWDREAYKNFGFLMDPDKLEGGGCTSFAGAFLRKAGVWRDLTPLWRRTTAVPKNLLGCMFDPPENTLTPCRARNPLQVRFITPSKILDGPWRASEKSEDLEFVDTELAVFTVMRLYAHFDKHFAGVLPRELVEQKRISRRVVGPSGPVVVQEPLTPNFDPFFVAIERAVSGVMSAGKRVTRENSDLRYLGSVPGLVIDTTAVSTLE